MDRVESADWLEVTALCADDADASRLDLQSLFARAIEDENDEGIEVLIDDIFVELESRASSAGSSYPFEVLGPLIRLRGAEWQAYTPYIFCLLVSWMGVRDLNDLRPARLFETIASTAAGQYLCGQTRHFGSPRPREPQFSEAVSGLCREIGEGQGFRFQPDHSRIKDDHVDLVAWRPHLDSAPGQVILFGQCATGRNWRDKLGELNPVAFCGMWMERYPISPLLKAFFTPHRVYHPEWEYICRHSGILFDRCRVSYWAHGHVDYALLQQWSEAMLQTARDEP